MDRQANPGSQKAADALERWRQEVRRVLPAADPDLIDEVTQHVTDRWLRARSEGASEGRADDLVQRDLDRWRTVPAPRHRPGWRAALPGAGWGADARYALRSVAVRPLFTVAALVLTTVAVAATVTTFAVAYGILWRPLPYPDAERLAVLWQVHEGERQQVSFPDYADISTSSVFESAAAMAGGRGSLRVDGRIERVNLLHLEAQGYAMLGATPMLGRLLHAGDGGRPNVMISHRLWRNQLQSDPEIIGRILWLSGTDYTVAGVLPAGFDFELPITRTLRLEDHDLWLVLDPSSPFIGRRDVSTFEALVRLAPGKSFPQAQAAIDVLGGQLAHRHAATNRGRTFTLVPLASSLVEPVRRPLLLVCLAAAAALAIALANLMTLNLARVSERQGELAVRLALGAGTLRLRRQFLTENATIAAAGAFAGFLLSVYLVRVLTGADAAHLPRLHAIRFDVPVFLFGAAVTMLIVALLTLVPFRLADATAALHPGGRIAGRSGRRSRQLLVAGELAIAVALSAGGALLGVSLVRLFRVDPGFAPAVAASVRVSAYQEKYPTLEHVQTFVTAILRHLEVIPGVERAAAGSSLPLSGQSTGTGVLVEGRPAAPGSRQGAGWQFVTPGYFDSLGIALRRGRDFSAEDALNDGHVTVINEELARALFGDENPIGRRITSGDGDSTDDWHQIIGVVGSVRHHALAAAPTPRVYDLFGEHWGRTLYVVVKTRMEDPGAALSSIRHTISLLDPEAPVFEISTMTALVERSAAPYRLSAGLATGLAVCAVLLTLIGIYAVAAAYVAERRREIGIRAALGAAPGDLLRLVLGEGLLTVALGAAAGVVSSLVAARLLAAQLFGVQFADVLVLLPALCGLLLVVSLAAAFPAARRAARTDPLIVMRTE